MAYQPQWVSLSQALQWVVESGAFEQSAQTQIANAIADRELHVRVVIQSSARTMAGCVFKGKNLEVPERLSARDFDWTQSVPKEDWATGPTQVESYWANWSWAIRPIALIEVSNRDLERIWANSKEGQKVSVGGLSAPRDPNSPASNDDKIAQFQPGSTIRRRGPQQKLLAVLLELHHGGKDIRHIHRDVLHRCVLKKAEIQGFGVSRSTFNRALTKALNSIEDC